MSPQRRATECERRVGDKESETQFILNLQTGKGKLASESLDIVRELLQLLVAVEGSNKVGQLLANLILDINRNLGASVQKLSDLVEVSLGEATGGQGRRSQADATGSKSRDVSVH
jgi:hypothetical protein